MGSFVNSFGGIKYVDSMSQAFSNEGIYFKELCFLVEHCPELPMPYILHKWGEKNLIQEWFDKNVGQNKGLFGTFKLLECPQGKEWPLDLCEKALSTTGAIKYLVDWVEAIEV